ncbi:tRNA (adenosine(37)-N6)-threonylcarbamoyltransferase complex dimerization subunit type 1 TsaB [Paenimyroides tangerinum]|uniref:tRNA (Adenosine(37)-N6)-threonylcarbamoyltransferase complex dimerization subunit type 1 TsaB n=1 Tax=Paenimyroides tangerinum TaxID=2488728 RepID=A0A3P3WK74_9FLAO|nr:tRNA (adenosine(37)-N6)-threonylcarbamoyltransferase complex dimerization subunit type 1 TsaB [Paenimyroides tangerinum]RRJ93283.1 tRNA (adenosine(37)-N6)-threonylcarbamoyltransferase complex dimerization subunit type 1 TsaB [Paenimyroides tangerinum]
MIYILNIETATKQCSVSVSKNNELIALRELAEENFNHAEKLHVFIEEVMTESNIKLSDLNAVSVSKGPGSYTGLRIGVSTAKGLCYALDIPLIAIDTLQIIAKQIQISEGIIQPMIDARRMEVFTASFDQKHQIVGQTKALVLDENSFEDIQEKIHFIGDGAEKSEAVLKSERFVYYSHLKYPSAKEMVELSYDAYLNKKFEDVAYFEPYYLKDFMLTTKK